MTGDNGGAGGAGGGENTGGAGGAGGEGGAGGDWAAKYGLDPAAVTSFQAKGFVGADGLDTGKLAKSYVEVERRMGGMVSLPEQGKINEWSGWDKLGAPADPAGYNLKLTLPEGLGYDNKLAERITAKAHSMKAPAHMVQGIAEEFAAYVGEATQARANEIKTAGDRLKGELSSVFGADEAARTARAQRAFRVMTADLTKTGDAAKDAEMIAANLNTMLGDAGTVLLFDRIAEALGEDKLITGDTAPGAPATVEQADSAITALRSDATFMKAFNTSGDPGHAAAVKKMNEAYAARSALRAKGS